MAGRLGSADQTYLYFLMVFVDQERFHVIMEMGSISGISLLRVKFTGFAGREYTFSFGSRIHVVLGEVETCRSLHLSQRQMMWYKLVQNHYVNGRGDGRKQPL